MSPLELISPWLPQIRRVDGRQLQLPLPRRCRLLGIDAPAARFPGGNSWRLSETAASLLGLRSGRALQQGTREPDTLRTHLGVGFEELFPSSHMEYGVLSAEDLVRACSQTGDPAAWEEFVRRFHRLIATVALRTARRCGKTSPHVIDELVQETYVKLCSDNFRLLRSFEPRHPDAFYGFLKVVTANLVLDHFKATRSEKRGSGTTEVPSESPVNAASEACTVHVTVESSERRILLQELDAILRRLAKGPNLDRDRRIFWLYYRVGLSGNAIASLPSIGLTTKGVESTILRLTRLLRREMLADRSRQGEG
jgi:RNA polymerase sigma-70 factor, ECF subfamily